MPWLAERCREKGHTVIAPEMPEARTPTPELWLPALEEKVGALTPETFFVGHSLGCRAIALYAQSRPADERAEGAVFVAGSFVSTLPPADDESERAVVRRRWHSREIDAQKVKARLSRIVGIYAPDDPWVSLENAAFVRDTLGGVLVLDEGKGHFRGKLDGIYELPSALSALETLLLEEKQSEK